jgi:uncharacterized protein YdhG (YjbR/CyaY superfamily)
VPRETAAEAADRIDAILTALPDDQRAALEHVRETVVGVVPDAEEGFSYGIPAYRYRGRPLAAYAAATGHCSFFPMSPAVIDAHREALAGFDLAKGTIRFQPAQPIPTELLTAIVRSRQAEIDAALGDPAGGGRRRRDGA